MVDTGTLIVVEDDLSITELIDTYLRREGYRVLLTADGRRAVELASTESPLAVILDLNLPGQMDGLDVCREIRKTSDTPIIMLSARDGELDRVLGLELGADDYVTKPFSPRELVARIKAILRRTHQVQTKSDTYIVGTVTLDLKRHEVLQDTRPVPFTTREFDLLAYLCDNRGFVLSRRQLLDGVWGPEWYGDDRTVDVHVRQLRKKLGDDFPLATIWGVGYRLD